MALRLSSNLGNGGLVSGGYSSKPPVGRFLLRHVELRRLRALPRLAAATCWDSMMSLYIGAVIETNLSSCRTAFCLRNFSACLISPANQPGRSVLMT